MCRLRPRPWTETGALGRAKQGACGKYRQELLRCSCCRWLRHTLHLFLSVHVDYPEQHARHNATSALAESGCRLLALDVLGVVTLGRLGISCTAAVADAEGEPEQE